MATLHHSPVEFVAFRRQNHREGLELTILGRTNSLRHWPKRVLLRRGFLSGSLDALSEPTRHGSYQQTPRGSPLGVSRFSPFSARFSFIFRWHRALCFGRDRSAVERNLEGSLRRPKHLEKTLGISCYYPPRSYHARPSRTPARYYELAFAGKQACSYNRLNAADRHRNHLLHGRLPSLRQERPISLDLARTASYRPGTGSRRVQPCPRTTSSAR